MQRRPATPYAAHRRRARRPAPSRTPPTGSAGRWSRTPSAAVLERVPGRRASRPTDVGRRRARARCPRSATSLRRVVNATGVVVHTNLGRAPLSRGRGRGGRRGRRRHRRRARPRHRTPRAARARARWPRWPRPCRTPAAVHVVNNGAAALALVTCALAPRPRGRRGPRRAGRDRRRLPDPRAAGVGRRPAARGRHHQPGAPRGLRRRRSASETAFVLKVHPSNFRVEGFTSVGAGRRARGARRAGGRRHRLRACWRPTRGCPTSPTPRPTLRAGAALVTASGDKLLGGPQCGLLLGDADLVQRLRRHPFARALRVDKLTLAALEATLTGPTPPVAAALAARPEDLLARAPADRRRARAPTSPRPSPSEAAVGGGGAPGVVLPSAAVALPAAAGRRRCAPGTRRSSATSPTAGCCSTCSRCRPSSTTTSSRRGTPRCEARTPDVHVVATAGHVDHGKSTLVRALTGRTRTGSRRSSGAGCRSSSATAGRDLDGVGRRGVRRRARPRALRRPRRWPGSGRCRSRCSWSPPTTRGCRRPPSTSPPSTRSACATACWR